MILTTDQVQLEAYQNNLAIVRDRIKAMITGHANGLYLYGRAGTSKTHTVRTTLEALGKRYKYVNAYLTATKLFDIIAENPDGIIILDDISELLKDPVALQILLAALGNSHDLSGVRIVRYQTANRDDKVRFTGAIILISNLQLNAHKSAVITALKDRIHVIHYDIPVAQIIAVIRDIASKGIHGISIVDCKLVAEFVIEECQLRNIYPSIRLVVHKALKDFSFWRNVGSETHWQRLVISDIEEQLNDLKIPTMTMSLSDEMEVERRIADSICEKYSRIEDRIREWARQTGKSQATFYRRKTPDRKKRIP